MTYTSEEVLIIYKNNESYAKEFLKFHEHKSYNDHFHITYAIPMQYKEFADEDPFVSIWFSLGMLVSNKIGETIRLIKSLPEFIKFIGGSQAESLYIGISEGMRTVFKDMTALEKTYRIVGITGLELLNKTSIALVSHEALSGFKARALLEEAAKKIALKMQQIDHRTPIVLEELYKSEDNLNLLKKTAYFLTEHEQKNVLQKIYNTQYNDYTETIGEILSNQRHPYYVQLAEIIGMTSIEIVEITVKLGTKNLSILDDRMLFASDLIEIVSQYQKSSIRLLKLRWQREEIVNTWYKPKLRLITNRYNSIVNNISNQHLLVDESSPKNNCKFSKTTSCIIS